MSIISPQFLQVSGQDRQSEMRSSKSLGDLKASVLKGSERVRKHSTGASRRFTHTPNTHSTVKMTVHNGFIISFVCTFLHQDWGMASKSTVTSGLLVKAWANHFGCFEWQRNRLKPSVWYHFPVWLHLHNIWPFGISSLGSCVPNERFTWTHILGACLHVNHVESFVFSSSWY